MFNVGDNVDVSVGGDTHRGTVIAVLPPKPPKQMHIKYRVLLDNDWVVRVELAFLRKARDV